MCISGSQVCEYRMRELAKWLNFVICVPWASSLHRRSFYATRIILQLSDDEPL